MTQDSMPDSTLGTKVCGKCRLPKALGEFKVRKDSPDGHRGICLECNRTYERAWARRTGRVRTASSVAEFDAAVADEQPNDLELVETVVAGGAPLASFGVPIERECAEALARTCSVVDAALELRLAPHQVRAHLSELQRRAAQRGWSPGNDMTKTTPAGFSVKGVSTLYDGEGNVRGQWVKTKADEQNRLAALLDAMSHIADRWTGRAEPVEAPPTIGLDDNLLNVIPLGDPHIGLLTWAPETGVHHDLVIAERELYAAADRLISIAPPARRALIASLGDFFHADNRGNTTTNGTPVDSDGRWPKVLRVGIRLMRRVIDRALERFEFVDVICSIGNHDWHSSIMLATCLAQFYEREPRVRIDTSPAKFHWHRFGQNLIGFTHGDTVKLAELPGIMAVDRAQDWGETRHRWMGVGHVHHDQVKEFPGCTVETIRTLAPGDAWHRGQGYRSGQDLKCLVFHREWGQITRHVVGIDYVRAMTAASCDA